MLALKIWLDFRFGIFSPFICNFFLGTEYKGDSEACEEVPS